jgi:murein DD-endopeptidase MepM/ murein hydrolase activator NlpD
MLIRSRRADLVRPVAGGVLVLTLAGCAAQPLGAPSVPGVVADGPTSAVEGPPRSLQNPLRWSWPVPSRVIVTPWGEPADHYAPGHRGVDIRADAGDAVAAPDDGTVAFSGAVAGRHVVTIDHGAGLVSTLDPVVGSVGAGDAVRRGQVTGVLEAGHCADGCLHLGARVDGEYVDPTPFLSDADWPVLLPDAHGVRLGVSRSACHAQALGWAVR